ncbi:hypothetical protein MKY37_02405 [Psychrobacillus sp. FSL K6-2836]|uniref:hypothetical protein n=1 Tax=Psychrobacillus sp. FSL K6-2836 TaxID=2921548 RepID=UPI0030F602DB
MELCEGKNIQTGTANEEQMYSLGKKIGEMHKILNSNNTVQLPYTAMFDLRKVC